MGRAFGSDSIHNPGGNPANGYGPAIALRRHSSSPSVHFQQWSERMRKANVNNGQNVGNPRRNVDPREIERRLSDAALEEGRHRYPFHTDKLMARDAGCTPEAMQKARERGKLSLRHVLMLALTWGPDVWRVISMSADEQLAECLRIEAWAQSGGEHGTSGGDGTDT